MSDVSEAMIDPPYLDFSDPDFSIRSAEVRAARDRSWFARTPYGIAVLRYDDVTALLRHPMLRQGSYRWPEHNGVTSGEFARWWTEMMLNQEGERHARLRKMGAPAFSPRLIAALVPKFQALANHLIDGFIDRGECDFVGEFAEPYATGVICELLGLPFERWRDLADIAAEMGLALGVTFQRDLARVEAATMRLFGYVDELIAKSRENPLDDFVGALVRANQDKDALDDAELRDLIVLAISGGIDTTRNQIGLGMSMFVDNPDQWALLGQRPELAKPAVEEVMRLRPTTTWVTREATAEFTHGGLTIPAGMTVHLISESAGSDPAHFTPGFDIAAQRKPHFGFGGGTHGCIGSFIARGDMTEALKLLAQRLHNPRYVGEVTFLPDSGNTGVIRMPLAFDRAQAG